MKGSWSQWQTHSGQEVCYVLLQKVSGTPNLNLKALSIRAAKFLKDLSTMLGAVSLLTRGIILFLSSQINPLLVS